MFPLRHAAARLLTSRSLFIATKPRSITTFASIPTRQSKFAAPIKFQRRWATGEAEAKNQEELPVSQLQPTPQEEVENAIHEDSAAATPEATQSAESAEPADSTEATDSGSFQLNAESDAQYSSRSARKPIREPASPKPTIYIGNLFFDVTENDLAKEFGRFGTIQKTRLIRDARGLSKGFGYVQFGSTEEAQEAINDMNQQLFEGRRLMCAFATTDEQPSRTDDREHKPINPPSKTLFIGNMSFEMTDRDLNNLFRGIRNVIDVRVAIDRRTGQPRGFAHADFVDVKSAMEAMKVLSGKENYGRKMRVDYSYGPSTAPRNTPR